MPILDPEFLDLTADLDAAAFWEEDALCAAFTTDKPRCALTFSPDDHWLFEFLDVSSTVRYYHDKAYRDDLHRQANEITLAYVGKTFFDEDTFTHQPRRIENLFGSEFTYTEGGTPWLTAVTDDPDEFAACSTAPRRPIWPSGPRRNPSSVNGKRAARRARRCRSWGRAAAARPPS